MRHQQRGRTNDEKRAEPAHLETEKKRNMEHIASVLDRTLEGIYQRNAEEANKEAQKAQALLATLRRARADIDQDPGRESQPVTDNYL